MPDHRVEIEPSARWVRVKFGSEFVADSRRVLLVREVGRLPLYYFPREDVRTDRLEPATDAADEDGKVYWNVKVGDHVAPKGAWSYPDPPPKYAALKNHLAFAWHKMDHWYEEEEEVFVHPRDPYKRVDSMPSSRHVRVVVNGETVADTHRPTLLFETSLPIRYYIPPEDVRMELLEPAQSTTRCPYKGIASYWSVKVGDEVFRNIVWGYQDPIPEAPKIKGLLSFYNEKVDLYVDGELQSRPKTPWS
ncbi:MAG: DUF427 domain-containing protein [Chloroflexi bacterium]|nr:DUF427 domain-containing protein [Chloroflexota bacterium]